MPVPVIHRAPIVAAVPSAIHTSSIMQQPLVAQRSTIVQAPSIVQPFVSTVSPPIMRQSVTGGRVSAGVVSRPITATRGQSVANVAVMDRRMTLPIPVSQASYANNAISRKTVANLRSNVQIAPTPIPIPIPTHVTAPLSVPIQTPQSVIRTSPFSQPFNSSMIIAKPSTTAPLISRVSPSPVRQHAVAVSSKPAALSPLPISPLVSNIQTSVPAYARHVANNNSRHILSHHKGHLNTTNAVETRTNAFVDTHVTPKFKSAPYAVKPTTSPLPTSTSIAVITATPLPYPITTVNTGKKYGDGMVKTNYDYTSNSAFKNELVGAYNSSDINLNAVTTGVYKDTLNTVTNVGVPSGFNRFSALNSKYQGNMGRTNNLVSTPVAVPLPAVDYTSTYNNYVSLPLSVTPTPAYTPYTASSNYVSGADQTNQEIMKIIR